MIDETRPTLASTQATDSFVLLAIQDGDVFARFGRGRSGGSFFWSFGVAQYSLKRKWRPQHQEHPSQKKNGTGLGHPSSSPPLGGGAAKLKKNKPVDTTLEEIKDLLCDNKRHHNWEGSKLAGMLKVQGPKLADRYV